MPDTLSKWIRKKLINKMGNRTLQLPILPPQRPRVLTPSPSHESLVLSAESAMANSAFFQKLPFELRHIILAEAFGNYTVHMDLCFDYPALPLQDPTHCHANIASRPKLDKSKPKQWRWWSSVCHRAPLSVFSTPGSDEPFKDECRQGESTWCDFWPGEEPGKCFVGAMGWLLSCQQALVYAEGIDILYSTNTIHMANTTMIRHLPQLLLPQRLASIRSVEMLWHLRPFQDAGPDAGLPAFHNLLDVLPSTFPRLRKLYVSLQGDMKPAGVPYAEFLDVSESAIMMPVDDMVRRLGPHLQECNIAIPTSLYEPRKYKATGTGLRWGIWRGGELERLWRELPETETGDGGYSAHLPGYWVRLGKRDINFPVMCTFGEGFLDDW